MRLDRVYVCAVKFCDCLPARLLCLLYVPYARSSMLYIYMYISRARNSFTEYSIWCTFCELVIVSKRKNAVCFVKIRLYTRMLYELHYTLDIIGPVPLLYSTIPKILSNLCKSHSHTNDFIRFIYSYLEVCV